MKKLSEIVSKKTGLSMLECESLIAVIGEELIEVLRDEPSVMFNKLGVIFRADNVDGRRLIVVLEKPIQEKLMTPSNTKKEIDDEIIFE